MSCQTYIHNRNWGCRVTEPVLEGYRCVCLENSKLRVTVIADKGADIYEFLYKPMDMDFLWRTWLGLRRRDHYIPSSARSAGAHMDYYEGGWQELFPNCGALSEHQGAEIGQHGEVMLLPWSYSITRDDPEEIEVSFQVRTVRTPFHLLRKMSLRRDEAVLRIRERITNEGGQDVDFTWGHHPALGWPFIDESCEMDLPACTIRTVDRFTPSSSRLAPEQSSPWPDALGKDGSRVDLSRVPGPEIRAQDMVFLEGLEEGWYAIRNRGKGIGFGMRYPADIFKVLWYWQVFRGGEGYPWWGSTYNLALEPAATWPTLSSAAAEGKALSLGAGESIEADLLAVAFEGTGQVRRITGDGEVIRAKS